MIPLAWVASVVLACVGVGVGAATVGVGTPALGVNAEETPHVHASEAPLEDEPAYETIEDTLVKVRTLKAQLLNLTKDELVDDDADLPDSERTNRGLIESGCSCSALAAISVQVDIFEEEIKGIEDLETKLNLVSAAVAKIGSWVSLGLRSPQGPKGPTGDPGNPGGPGPAGAPGQDIILSRTGMPGPPGEPGHHGAGGLKGAKGDCIKGEKGTRGPKGAMGYGQTGIQGSQGVPGDAGPPAMNLKEG